MARTALITLEATALIRTALDVQQFGWRRRSAALEQLEGSARLLLGTLAEESHVPVARKQRSRQRGNGSAASPPPCRRWRHAGVAVTEAVEAGVAEYVRLREGSEGPVVGVADLPGHTREQIDVNK